MLESSVVVISKLSPVVVFASASVPETVPEKVGLASVLFDNVSVVSVNTISPDASGNKIVLSAVGSATANVVSKLSAVEPSKVNEFVIAIVVESIAVVDPCTVKSPVTVKFVIDELPLTDIGSANVIGFALDELIDFEAFTITSPSRLTCPDDVVKVISPVLVVVKFKPAALCIVV